MAFLYRIAGVDGQVGRALKKVIPSVVKREELFITSKLWNNSHQPDQVVKELDETLSLLGLDYLDLYRALYRGCIQFERFIYLTYLVVHWPVAYVPNKAREPSVNGWVELDMDTPVVETWKEVIKLPATGKVCSLICENKTFLKMNYFIFDAGQSSRCI